MCCLGLALSCSTAGCIVLSVSWATVGLSGGASAKPTSEKGIAQCRGPIVSWECRLSAGEEDVASASVLVPVVPWRTAEWSAKPTSEKGTIGIAQVVSAGGLRLEQVSGFPSAALGGVGTWLEVEFLLLGEAAPSLSARGSQRCPGSAQDSLGGEGWGWGSGQD